MPYPIVMNPRLPTPDVVSEAKLLWLMPGANELTRAVTAAILTRDGLLDAPPTAPVLRPAAVRQQSAVCRARAAALHHEVHWLCARAVALRCEAEELCKPRL